MVHLSVDDAVSAEERGMAFRVDDPAGAISRFPKVCHDLSAGPDLTAEIPAAVAPACSF
jgi:hypothetical protein